MLSVAYATWFNSEFQKSALYARCNYAEFTNNICILSVIVLMAFIQSDIILSDIMLSVFMPSVMVPIESWKKVPV